MDYNSLSQLLFKAKKENNTVELIPNSSRPSYFIGPDKNVDLNKEDIVLDDMIISLDSIGAAQIIDNDVDHVITSIEELEKWPLK